MSLEPNKVTVQQCIPADGLDTSVKSVTLICKNHLDIGFTESAAKVTHDAINWMLPVAIDQARQLRHEGGGDNFVWTTPSWIIARALQEHRGKKLASIEQACAAGDLAWHALPFTSHTELMDTELFEFGLSLSQELDARFGRQTIAAKMTDVPGHTRSMIPLLAAAKVSFLHIGVNHMSAVPNVPPAFRWRDPASGTELVVFYCRGYGGTHRIANHDQTLAFHMVGDNMEVPSVNDVRSWLAGARNAYPNATVRFGRMDDYACHLPEVLDQLPIIESEIGDTWIHGVGTDPAKTARLRALLRERKAWLKAGRILKTSPSYVSFSMPLLLTCEHTWGVSIGPHLQDTTNFPNQDFYNVRHRGNYLTCEASWREQRDYLEDATQAARKMGFSTEADIIEDSLRIERPDLSGWITRDPQESIQWDTVSLKLDPNNGAVIAGTWANSLIATPATPLGLLRYQSVSATDMDIFRKSYCNTKEEWATVDFGKLGLLPAHADGHWWLPELAEVYSSPTEPALWLQLSFPKESSIRYGAPAEVWLQLAFDPHSQSLTWDLRWFRKTATRLPEALWFSCAPQANPNSWRMLKLGQWINPLDVVQRGARRLHAVETLRANDPASPWQLTSLDAPLVAPGDADILCFDDRQPDLSSGWHFNLWNNFWGTNFPQWYDEDARFRFNLQRN